MRLLIQEYVAMLKERDELEAVLTDLCTSMGYRLVSIPQAGVGQAGVDLHAVGIDPEDGQIKNFLITIKRGDVDKSSWNAGNNAVRPSLDEIFDVYLDQRLGPDEINLPSKIILCCGGVLKQEINENWVGYRNGKATSHPQVSLKLWNGAHLAMLIEEHLLNEHIFIDEVRRKMRRTLVVLADEDYDLSHFKSMLGDLLFNEEWGKQSSGLERKALKALSTIPVCLGMINEYSSEANNLKHPLLAAEHSLLRVWDFIRKHNLQNSTKVLNKYYELETLYFKYGANYFQKMSNYWVVKDGLTRMCRSHIDASVLTFEHIGLLSSLGIAQVMHALAHTDEQAFNNAKAISDALVKILKNNPISGSPCFDSMAIDICIGITLLTLTERGDDTRNWISEIINRFHFSYALLGKNFPVDHSSIEDLVEFNYGDLKKKEDMLRSSTLLPTLAYWCAILNFEEQYDYICKFVDENLQACDLQIWYPTKGIKEKFYSSYTAHEYGASEAPIHLPQKLSELKERLKLLLKTANEESDFETNWNDAPEALPYIASRHHRTPVVPFLWLFFINRTNVSQNISEEEKGITS